jgi:hypothetical protein
LLHPCTSSFKTCSSRGVILMLLRLNMTFPR